MIKYAVFGANGGIGHACCEELAKHDIHADQFTRDHLDFEDTDAVSKFDLSGYSHIINATGTTIGTYQGFLKNDPENIVKQITVNLTNNLLLLKNFINQNLHGHYTWIGSIVSETPRPFHSVYGCTKLASTFATKLISQEAVNFKITEVRLGLTATNFRYTNYNGSKTKAQVDEEYANANAMDAGYCATKIVNGIFENQTLIEINESSYLQGYKYDI